MNARPLDRLAIALAQLNPTVGDVAGNAEKVRRARATGGGRRRRPHPVSRTVHRRLSAGRPGAQAGVPGGLPRRDRGARARDRRWRSGGAGRHAMGRGRQALQRRRAARRRPHRGAALQGRSAELRRVRREARVRARAAAGTGEFPRRAASACRSARTSGARSRSSASPRPAAKSCWCRTARPIAASVVDERLNVAVARVTETGLPLIYLNQVGGQDELVFDGASVRAQCRRLAGRAASGLREAVVTDALASARHRRLALRAGPDRRSSTSATRPTTPPACWACATMSTRTAFQGVVLGLSGGIDSALVRGDRRRRARAPSACAR